MFKSIIFIRAAVLSGGIVLTGCGGGDWSASAVQRKLEDQRALWAANNLNSYQVVFRQSCFCGPGNWGPRTLVVRDGEVVDAILVETGESVFDDDASANWFTIAQAFDYVQDLVGRHPDVLKVEYDSVWHYPIKIEVDMYVNSADDELVTWFSDLEV